MNKNILTRHAGIQKRREEQKVPERAKLLQEKFGAPSSDIRISSVLSSQVQSLQIIITHLLTPAVEDSQQVRNQNHSSEHQISAAACTQAPCQAQMFISSQQPQVVNLQGTAAVSMGLPMGNGGWKGKATYVSQSLHKEKLEPTRTLAPKDLILITPERPKSCVLSFGLQESGLSPNLASVLPGHPLKNNLIS